MENVNSKIFISRSIKLFGNLKKELSKVRKVFLERLIKSLKTSKYDTLINFFIPIKRGKLVYKHFGLIIK